MFNYFLENSPLIADTHYAGFLEGIYSGKFERGLSEGELVYLSSNFDLELILITLDPKIVLDRRKNDSKNKRDFNFENIKKEIEANTLYFEEYCSQLGKIGTIIENLDYNLAIKALCKLIQ